MRPEYNQVSCRFVILLQTTGIKWNDGMMERWKDGRKDAKYLNPVTL